MQVLILTDEAYHGIPGGHRVQIDSTVAGLRELSVDVSVASEPGAALDGVDVVHSFGAPAAWTRPAREAGIPVVVSPVYWSQSYVFGLDTPRSWRERFVTGGRIGASTVRRGPQLTSWRVLTPHLKQLLSIESADLIAANSEAEARAIRAELGTSTPTCVVPNCVDSRLFRLPDSGATRRGVLCVARLEPHKNQLSLIRALAGTGIPLKIVGHVHPHHPGYLVECRNAADSSVELLDGRSHENLVALYQQAEVHAMPSWFETTGLATLEANLCGAAVVSTDRGYVRDYFGDDAHYANPADLASIRDAVVRALKAGHSMRLRQRILGEFTQQHAARATLKAYRRALRA